MVERNLRDAKPNATVNVGHRILISWDVMSGIKHPIKIAIKAPKHKPGKNIGSSTPRHIPTAAARKAKM